MTVQEAIFNFSTDVKTFVKDTSGFGYKYNTLEDIVEYIRPLLKKHNLFYTQSVDAAGDYIYVETTVGLIGSDHVVRSRTGCRIESLKGMNIYQSMGSAITYFRRYDLSTVLGLLSEKDDDASGKTDVVIKTPDKKAPEKPTAPKPAPAQDSGDAAKAEDNRPILNDKHEKWNAVVDFIKSGGEIEQVRKKYKFTATVEKKLLSYKRTS